MSAYTAGPWTCPGINFLTSNMDAEIHGGLEAQTELATIHTWGSADYIEEARANAHLICAAPDMLHALVSAKRYLEAVRCLLGTDEDSEGVDSQIHELSAAIAKATGANEL